RILAQCWIEYSSCRSLIVVASVCRHGIRRWVWCRITNHCDKQIRDAWRAHFTECRELLTIGSIEQHDVSANSLAFVNRLKRAGRCELVGFYCDFGITRFEIFHAAIKNDASAIDEHEISKDVLNFFDLMCSDNDRATAIEVVVEQRVVELLAIKNIEAERRLIKHEQPRINRHD